MCTTFCADLKTQKMFKAPMILENLNWYFIFSQVPYLSWKFLVADSVTLRHTFVFISKTAITLESSGASAIPNS